MLRDIAFDPVEVVAARGVSLELVITNEGLLEHDFTIREIDAEAFLDGRHLGADPGDHDHGDDAHGEHMMDAAIHVPVSPGRTVRLDLVIKFAGTFEFYCAVEGHREAGMAGILRVTDN